MVRDVLVIDRPQHQSNSLGIASMVLGCLAFLICWIPFINVFSLIFAAIGLVLALIGFIISLTRGGAGIGYPIAGGVICFVPGMIAIIIISAVAAVGTVIVDTAVEIESGNKPIENHQQVDTNDIETDIFDKIEIE